MKARTRSWIEIPPGSSQNVCHQEKKWQQMLLQMWEKRNHYSLLGECKLVQQLWLSVQRFLTKLKIDLACGLPIPLLGIHLKESMSVHYRDICMSVLTSLLVAIAKKWGRPRCPSTNKWIKKVWYTCTKRFCSTIKKSGNKIPQWKGVELKNHVKQTKSDSEGKLSHFVSYSELRFQCSSDEIRRRTMGGKEAGSVGDGERAGNRTHMTWILRRGLLGRGFKISQMWTENTWRVGMANNKR